MTYLVAYSPTYEKQLATLMRGDRKLAEQIRAASSALASDPRPPGCKKLKGRVEWRIRVRTWRVVYTINDQHLLVDVLETDARKDIY